jgi:hypothetical protein
MQDRVRSEGWMRHRILPGLVVDVPLLGESGSALAAGKMGGASGADEFARSVSSGSEGSTVGDGTDRCDQLTLLAGSI